MKILLLFACITASAAPLPPFPTAARPPIVKPFRPAGTVIPPTGAPSSFREITYTSGIDFFGCEGQPGCVLYNNTHISINHADEVNTILEATAVATPAAWVMIGQPLPPGFDEVSWYEDRMQPARFFRLTDVPLTTIAAKRKAMSPKYKVFGWTTWKRSPLTK